MRVLHLLLIIALSLLLGSLDPFNFVYENVNWSFDLLDFEILGFNYREFRSIVKTPASNDHKDEGV